MLGAKNFPPLIAAVTLVAAGCFGFSGPPGPQDVIIESQDGVETIAIVDQTGKKWDVTHGVQSLGFAPRSFQYGLGPNAITPLIYPRMATEGDPGYPSDSEGFRVIGISEGEDARAYPVGVLARHEVIDDDLNGSPLLVAY